MRYDLELVKAVCAEQGFAFEQQGDRIEIFLGEACVLCVNNDEPEGSGVVWFKGTAWHTHANLLFSDSSKYIQMTYLEALVGLGEGSVLICTLVREGLVRDRWLVHCEYNNELKHMQPGEKVVVSRAVRSGP